jgi:hypothetical protein
MRLQATQISMYIEHDYIYFHKIRQYTLRKQIEAENRLLQLSVFSTW